CGKRVHLESHPISFSLKYKIHRLTDSVWRKEPCFVCLLQKSAIPKAFYGKSHIAREVVRLLHLIRTFFLVHRPEQIGLTKQEHFISPILHHRVAARGSREALQLANRLLQLL